MTAVKKCRCLNKFQDETYGQGNRLHNIGVNQFRCTVCQAVIKGETKPDKKKGE